MVRCGKCRYESITFVPFQTISLQHKSSLEKCIVEHLSEKAIDDLYTCEKCGKNSKAKKGHMIVHLPRVLCFHIKRFDSSFRKIEKHTSYPLQLNL